ncbi:MAG: hypothetical protein ACYDH9_23465 [Limisphaerales bacterium]
MRPGIHFCQRLALGLAVLAAPWLFISCATSPFVLGTVGPQPGAGRSATGDGNLIVYSDTDEKHLDKTTTFYVHTSYLIETSDGKRVRWVANHLGDMDEAPQRVPLPAGTYQVVARSEDYGRVYVPVAIEGGKTTEVHLADTWQPIEKPAEASQLVRFPNGYIVGWAASTLPRSTGGP